MGLIVLTHSAAKPRPAANGEEFQVHATAAREAAPEIAPLAGVEAEQAEPLHSKPYTGEPGVF